jgi:hypothetical protein
LQQQKAEDDVVHSEKLSLAPALLKVDWEQIQTFQAKLQEEKIEMCSCCNECWFQMKIRTRPLEDVCAVCAKDIRTLKNPTDLLLFSDTNSLDPGTVPADLPTLSEVEEMLITCMHVHLQVVCVCGQQFRYTGHVVCFRQNTPKIWRYISS